MPSAAAEASPQPPAPEKRVQIFCRLRESTFFAVRWAAAQQGIGQGEWLERLIESLKLPPGPGPAGR